MPLRIYQAVLLIAVAAFWSWYIYAVVSWGIPRHDAAPYVWLYVLLGVAVAGSMSLAVLSLTPGNVGRVQTSTIIICLGAVLGTYVGDPMTQGSYDHGFGESEIGWLMGGIGGALGGWGVSLVWNLCRTDRARAEGGNANQESTPSVKDSHGGPL